MEPVHDCELIFHGVSVEVLLCVCGGGGRERVKQEEFLFDGEGKVATCSLDWRVLNQVSWSRPPPTAG